MPSRPDTCAVVQTHPDIRCISSASAFVYANVSCMTDLWDVKQEMRDILELFRHPAVISAVISHPSRRTLALVDEALRLGLLQMIRGSRRPLHPSSITKALYALSAGSVPKRNIRKYVTRSGVVDGSPFFVLDGLFDASEIASTDRFFRSLSYQMNRQSSYDDRSYLYAGTRLPIDLPMYERIGACVKNLFPHLHLEPRKALSNAIRYGDYQSAHVDTLTLPPRKNEIIVTAVYYVNKRWDPAWQGETVFYDKKGEPQHVIAPRPGRVVLSHGTMMHRSGVPSRLCQEQRMSLAVQYRPIV